MEDTMTTTTEAPEATEASASQRFVTASSLRNYATATACLTVVINIILYAYSAMKGGKVMPITFVIPTGIILTTAYALSFFKREKGSAIGEYIWVTAMNSIMLFTSISGVNSMLDSARQSFLASNNPTSTIQTQAASFGGFFKHLLFPTHGFFSESEKMQAIIDQSIKSIETTNDLMDTLLVEKEKLTVELDSTKKRYDTIYARINRTEEFLVSIQPYIEQSNIEPVVKAKYYTISESIGSSKKDFFYQKQQFDASKMVAADTKVELESQQSKLLIQKERLVRLRTY